jgi:glycosyl transferase family 25
MENINKVIYINLDRRTDRKENIENELKRMGLEFERFTAIENKPEMLGCCKSHIEVLKMARKNNWKNVLILEDDFEFIISKTELNFILNEFFENYKTFDVVMLSYNVIKGERINSLISKAIEVQTASGYLVNNKIYDELIDVLSNGYDNLEKTHKHWLYMNDVSWYNLQQKSEWYFFTTRIGRQKAGYSDLQKQHVDYKI